LAACAAALIAFGGGAKAATASFIASGFWEDQFHDIIPLLASITVDIPTGLISDASFKLNSAGFGFTTFTDIIGQAPLGATYALAVQTPVFNAGFDSGSCTAGNGCHDQLNVLLSANPTLWALQQGGFVVSGSAALRDANLVVNLIPGTVFSPAAVPLPAALPLFASGVALIGLLGWRKKRKALRS